MNYCKNCKFWKRRKLYYRKWIHKWWNGVTGKLDEWNAKPFTIPDDGKILEEKEQDSMFGECTQGCMQYTQGGGCIEDDDLGNNNSDGLIYSDGEAYGAYLYTGENFGCVHWEEK